MGTHPIQDKKLFGTATVGTKGQVVIPADAREALDISQGDRLYVVGKCDAGVLVFFKEDALESVMEHMTAQVENFRALKQEKEKE